jgi:hypothetical protein
VTGRTRRVNDIGAGKAGVGNERMRDFRVYVEDGLVRVWVEVADFASRGDTSVEVMQYLTADEAMFFAKAFERCAIEALRQGAE